MLEKDNYLTATGKIRYTMTNDYMFRAILQENKFFLRGLISSLLHMQQEDIKTITIQNPIILGEAFNDKTSILDIHIKLNNNSYLNIEMQVLRDPHWTNRSLFYLCRTFSKLKKGEKFETKR